jgi:hypothetical protein
MRDVNFLMAVVFSGLSVLVIEDVADDGGVIRVVARTRDALVPCPVCGVATGKVHGYRIRTVADVPVDGRQVVARVRVRRLACPVLGCRRQTFREQVPGLIERLQRRTTRLARQVSEVVKESCGRAPLSPHLLPGHALALRHRPAPAAAGPSADGRPAPGDRDRRLRPAPPPPLRHDHHRRRDRAARRCPGRPRSRHRGGMAAREEKGRGRVPGRLSHLRRGHPTGITACRAGQRPLAPVAEPVRQGPGRGPRPAPCWATVNPPRPGGVREQTTRERRHKSPHLPRPGRRPARMCPPVRARPEHGKTLRPQPRTVC